MIQPGTYQTLISTRTTPQGLYLDAGHLGEILMPKRYIPEGHNIGDEVHIFIYFDSEDRLVATTETPKGVLGDIVALQVVSLTENIAFLDWGLAKDLLLPLSTLKYPTRKGDFVVVRIDFDKVSERLLANGRIEKFLIPAQEDIQKGKLVNAICYGESPLGYKMVVNHKHSAMLYRNTVFRNVAIGEETSAFITNVREDGKLDISLNETGYDNNIPALSEKILSTLVDLGGKIDFDDKADPEQIKATFQCSKKCFKKAVGLLYKERKIVLENNSIKLPK